MSDEIHIELLKLADGKRLLRFKHMASGLCLEKTLEAALPVVTQKEHWRKAFESLLIRELLTT